MIRTDIAMTPDDVALPPLWRVGRFSPMTPHAAVTAAGADLRSGGPRMRVG